MILGFISLLLTVGTKYIAKICIPEKIGNTMLPCDNDHEDEGEGEDDKGGHRRKLFYYTGEATSRRVLAVAAAGDGYCSEVKC